MPNAPIASATRRKLAFVPAVGFMLLGLLVGLSAWGGYEGVTSYVTTNAFCTSCHEMQPLEEEYKQSIHYVNPAGVRAQCADCHVPKPFVARIVHMIGASNDVLGHLRGIIDTPAKFEAHRLDMAKRVWAEFTANGSLECRGCHTFEAMDFAHQRPKAAEAMHAPMPPGTSCINCHKGIAHRLAVSPVKPVAIVRPPPVAAPVAAPPAGNQAAVPPAGAVPAGSVPAGSVPTGAGVASAASAAAFVGEATAPLAAGGGGAPFATLYVSAPLAVIATDAGVTHVKTRLWMKAEALGVGPLYAGRDGIEVGRLDSTPDANVRPGSPGDGWMPVELDGYLAADAVAASLEPAWQAAESTYEFTCAGCHVLHPAEAYTPAQWSTEMVTMARSANLRPDDAMLLLKWLQTNSAASRAGKQ